jgi:hypothetical protein
LPTSLDYISLRPEAVHLGDLLRIWVRPGAVYDSLARIFKCRQECTGHAQEVCSALRALQHPYLRLSRFQGVRPLQRKENSSQDFACISRSFALPHRALHVGQSPCPGSGILTRFPFDYFRHLTLKRTACFQNGISLSLRTD